MPARNPKLSMVTTNAHVTSPTIIAPTVRHMAVAFPICLFEPDSNRSGLGVRDAPVDGVVIILGELAREVADFEIPRPRRADKGHFGRATGEEHLFETLKLVRP